MSFPSEIVPQSVAAGSPANAVFLPEHSLRLLPLLRAHAQADKVLIIPRQSLPPVIAPVYLICRPSGFAVRTVRLQGYFSDCADSFKAYLCFINFPRCDEQDKSLVMCRSTCENLLDTCHIPYDLQRCGPPEWHNGNEPEEMLFYNDAGSYPILMRDFFPGQPFRENQYEDEARKIPKIVCTPSIPGAASRAGSGPSAVVLAISAAATAAAVAARRLA